MSTVLSLYIASMKEFVRDRAAMFWTFAFPVFFIVLRETIEAAIVVSVLLAFLKQTLDGPNRGGAVYKAQVKQVSRCPCLSTTHS